MSPHRPQYGWYGDDFTGATDTLATIAERGHHAFLFLDIPDEPRLASVGELDAIGLAGAARTMSRAALEAELAPVGPFFRELGVRLTHFKCCSTFDSSTENGNLAVAIEALRTHVDCKVVPIIGGQPSLERYCLFSNLFAAANGEIYRLDRHPTMSRHPVTPMHEADLGRHLAGLGLRDIAAITWRTLDVDAAGAWRRHLDDGQAKAVLLDAATNAHLVTIGDLLRQTAQRQSLLVLGASSVAEAYFPEQQVPASARVASSPSPVLAISGSLSPMSRQQVEAAGRYEKLSIAPETMRSAAAVEQIASRAAALLRDNRNVLLSSAPTDGGVLADAGFAERCALLIGDIITQYPVRRLAVAGGDTSSRIIQSLNVWGLQFSRRLAKGVSVCVARLDDPARDGMEIMLKGGQMGHTALFDAFAAGGEVAK